jgi:GNAT superfamily N-acetyltransferase
METGIFMGNLSFCKVLPEDAPAISGMVAACFNEFVAPGFSNEGVAGFLDYVRPEAFKERLGAGNFAFASLDGGAPVGYIEVRSCLTHICLLFVNKEYQRKGIAKKLLGLAVAECGLKGGRTGFLDVNSSPYAVPVYEKMGFVKTGDEQTVKGITFTPMKLYLPLLPRRKAKT